MLERMREGSQGLLAKIIVGAIILSFALFGIGNYINGPSQTPAAEVNGQSISLQELERAYQQQSARLQQQLGEAYNRYASDPEFISKIRQEALQSLVSQTLIEQKAMQLGLRIGDGQLEDEIKKLPFFQVDGKFDNQRFNALLNQNRISPEQFSNDYRQELLIKQLQIALADSDFGLPYEAAEVKRLRDQKREIKQVNVATELFKQGIEVTDEALSAHYDKTKADYQIPEKVSVEYLELSQDALSKSMQEEFTVTEAQVKSYYEDNLEQFVIPAKQKIAQIQVNISDDELAAKTKIEAVLAKLKAGADFAETAKAESEDLFSAATGGELSAYKAENVDESFANAVNELSVGQLSEIVKTEQSFHIIKLLSEEAEKQQSLAEVKDSISEQLKTKLVNDKFYTMQTELVNLAFESPDSLKEVASEMKLEMKTEKDFSRFSAPQALRNPKVLQLAFDPLMIEKAENSEVIEINPEHFMVIRVIAHTPASHKALAEVKEQVKESYIQVKAKEAAGEYIQDLVSDIEDGKSIEEKLAKHELVFSELKTIGRYEAGVEPAISRAVFAMPKPTDGVSAKKVTQANGDYALVLLSKVIPAELSELKDSIGIEQIANEQANATVKNLLAMLTEQAEINYYKLPN